VRRCPVLKALPTLAALRQRAARDPIQTSMLFDPLTLGRWSTARTTRRYSQNIARTGELSESALWFRISRELRAPPLLGKFVAPLI
jgi:hypothetical protein